MARSGGRAGRRCRVMSRDRTAVGEDPNEELVGRALKGRRDGVVLATKFGRVSHAGDGPGNLEQLANIRTAVEGSFASARHRRDRPLLQHRVDPHTPMEDTVGALAELVAEGKIRHIREVIARRLLDRAIALRLTLW